MLKEVERCYLWEAILLGYRSDFIEIKLSCVKTIRQALGNGVLREINSGGSHAVFPATLQKRPKTASKLEDMIALRNVPKHFVKLPPVGRFPRRIGIGL
jgi:hypothetical protein